MLSSPPAAPWPSASETFPKEPANCGLLRPHPRGYLERQLNGISNDQLLSFTAVGFPIHCIPSRLTLVGSLVQLGIFLLMDAVGHSDHVSLEFQEKGASNKQRVRTALRPERDTGKSEKAHCLTAHAPVRQEHFLQMPHASEQKGEKHTEVSKAQIPSSRPVLSA